MNQMLPVIIAAAAILIVVFLFVAVWASRYVKVGPNRVLIVSGRQFQRPDGTTVGFRIVKGGGTFVFPVVEEAGALSLEVFDVDMPGARARTANGARMEADCHAQVKINSDDASIHAAAEHFLSKTEPEIRDIVRPVLEQNFRTVVGSLSDEEAGQNLDAFADEVRSSASTELGRMGLTIISFGIRNIHGV